MAEKEPQTKDQKEAWEEALQTGADINRYNNKFLGIHHNANDEPPMPSEVNNFIDNLADFAEDTGKTTGAFIGEVDNQTRQNAEKSIGFNKTGFYRQVYEVSRHKLEEKFEKKHGFVSAFFNKVKNLFSKNGEIPEKYNKFMENLEEYEKIKNELVALDGALLRLERDLLPEAEKELIEKKGSSDEKEVRSKIDFYISSIADATNKRIKKLIPMQEIGKKNQEIWAQVEQALEDENHELTKKFSGKIDKLFQKRQMLIGEIGQYDMTNHRHTKKTYELREKIFACESELESIKQDLIKYRSKNPIFLFERILGVQSIPLLDRYWQVTANPSN